MLKSGRGLLRSALLAALLATFLIYSASAATLTTLGPGSRGEAVVTLKNELNEKGYYTVKNDTSDVYTTSLKSAVGVFQKANNIIPAKYGYADEQTQIRAASDDAILHSEYIEKQMDTQLQPGGSGDYVKKAQKQLTKLGYYAGKIDGRYRSLTVAAVKFFEKANSLAEDGIADRDTRAVLYSPDAKTRAKYEEENYLTPLNLGAKGEQVKKLQEQLSSLGFYWDVPSEVYDAQTKYSVKFFQEANGFSITGNASKTLRTKLNGGSCITFAEYTKNMQLVQLSSSARPGIKVAVLQLQLSDKKLANNKLGLGYYKGVITGAYSGSVITAVRTFQIFNNLPSQYVTGKANTETRKRMLPEAEPLHYDAVCGDDTLKPGDKGVAVTNMQNRLKALKYYTGEADGQYDGDVTKAVKLFQKYNGLYQSGIAYTQTLTLLNSDSAKTYVNGKVVDLIKVAGAQIGKPYSTKCTPPKSFDCSRFTAYCFSKVGVNITGEVSAQGKRTKGTRIYQLSDLKPGDLLFYDTQTDKKPGHAAIYIGLRKGVKTFIHASSAGGSVMYSPLNKEWYVDRFMWAIRIWE